MGIDNTLNESFSSVPFITYTQLSGSLYHYFSHFAPAAHRHLLLRRQLHFRPTDDQTSFLYNLLAYSWMPPMVSCPIVTPLTYSTFNSIYARPSSSSRVVSLRDGRQVQ